MENTDVRYHSKQKEILRSTFSYLVENGLESASDREIGRAIGVAPGKFYYWFKNKEELILEATKYGFDDVACGLFAYAVKEIETLAIFYEDFVKEATKHRNAFRFLTQMASSPVYGDAVRAHCTELDAIYDEYIRRAAECLDIDREGLKPYFHLLISVLLNYMIWSEEERTRIQLQFIRKGMKGLFETSDRNGEDFLKGGE